MGLGQRCSVQDSVSRRMTSGEEGHLEDYGKGAGAPHERPAWGWPH